jgi:hypothetical protein
MLAPLERGIKEQTEKENKEAPLTSDELSALKAQLVSIDTRLETTDLSKLSNLEMCLERLNKRTNNTMRKLGQAWQFVRQQRKLTALNFVDDDLKWGLASLGITSRRERLNFHKTKIPCRHECGIRGATRLGWSASIHLDALGLDHLGPLINLLSDVSC